MLNNFGKKLKSLREQNNLSLKDLSDKVGVSRQAIHRYENDVKSPSSSTLLKISDVLDTHPSYFFQDEDVNIEIDNIYFRDEHKFSAKDIDLEKIKTTCKHFLQQFWELNQILGENIAFENPLHGTIIKSRKDVEKAAKNLRRKWKLGNAPIANVTEVIENNHISVIELETLVDFTGLSGFANESVPFIVINSNCSDVTRKRFTLLHELGHIILDFHDSICDDFMEKLCHHFAGAVLLVDDTIIQELGKNRTTITLQELKTIKEKYGVSIQAIIIRARTIGLISKSTSDKWWELYEEWNQSSNDAVDFGVYNVIEKPKLFHKLLRRGVLEKRITWGKAAELENSKVDILKHKLKDLEFTLN